MRSRLVSICSADFLPEAISLSVWLSFSFVPSSHVHHPTPKHPSMFSSMSLSPPLGQLYHNLLCSSHKPDVLHCLRQIKRTCLAPGHSTELKSAGTGIDLRFIATFPRSQCATAPRVGKVSPWLQAPSSRTHLPFQQYLWHYKNSYDTFLSFLKQ